MNKTISITLGGLIFNLEEDAYQKLKQYLSDVRNHLGASTDKDEVISDIESSIAEKFSKKINDSKHVITSEDIDELIEIMGTVNDFDEEPPKDQTQQKNGERAEEKGLKKLYRNPDDMIIGGVCSGLAAYFGIDHVIIRVFFAISIFFGGFGIILYIILWIIIPEAKSSSQKLEMAGDSVTLAAIEQVIKKNVKRIKEQNNNDKIKTSLQKIIELPLVLIKALATAFKSIGPILIAFFGFIFFITGIISIIAISIGFWTLFFNLQSPYLLSDIPLNDLANDPLFKLFLISLYLVIIIPISFLLTLGISLMRQKSAFTLLTFTSLIGLWMIALMASTGIGFRYVPVIESKVREYQNQEYVSQELPLKDFNQIEAGSNIDVNVKKGEIYSVIIKGSKEGLTRVDAKIINGKLQLQKEAKQGICLFCVDTYRPVNVIITLPELISYEGKQASKLTMSGFTQESFLINLKEAARADVKADINNIKIEQSSASSLTLSLLTSTSSESMIADLKSASRLRAYDFPTKKAEIKIRSASYAEINVSEELIANAHDASRLFYTGLVNDENTDLDFDSAAKIIKIENPN